jgi:protein transport protein SEC20
MMDVLHERLATLQETAVRLKELVDRLAGLDFGPGEFESTWDAGATVAGLGGEIAHLMRGQEEELELLHEEVLDVRGGRPGSDAYLRRQRLKDGVARLEQELQRCVCARALFLGACGGVKWDQMLTICSHRTTFRKTLVTAKRKLADAQRAEREMMLQAYDEPPEQEEEASKDHTSAPTNPDAPRPSNDSNTRPRHYNQQDSLLTKEDRKNVSVSQSMTQRLREMHALMASELTKSEFARETLEESTQMLQSLGESYDSLEGVLTASANLVGTLMRSQKSDTWYLKTSFYIAAGTLAWLVFRRWLYGPLWWLVWLPLRIAFGVSIGAGRAIVSTSSGHESAAGAAGAAADAAKSAAAAEHAASVVGLPDDSLPTLDVGGSEGSEEAAAAEWIAEVVEDMEAGGHQQHQNHQEYQEHHEHQKHLEHHEHPEHHKHHEHHQEHHHQQEIPVSDSLEKDEL